MAWFQLFVFDIHINNKDINWSKAIDNQAISYANYILHLYKCLVASRKHYDIHQSVAIVLLQR